MLYKKPVKLSCMRERLRQGNLPLYAPNSSHLIFAGYFESKDMEITESIIHGVVKAKETIGEGSVVIRPRKEVLPVDEKLEALCADVLSLYTKLSNGYGTFGLEEIVHPFPPLLKSYVTQDIDLVAFSENLASLIASKMQDQFMATTSWPLYVRYTNQGRDWLLIALLKLKDGVGIDEDTLDLNNSLSFDISHLHEAARIDINKWLINEQPYLSFIKRRAGDSDISRYFRNALSCTEYTDAKHNTDVTIKAVEDFCEAKGWNPERTQNARDKLYNFCAEMKHNELPVNLGALSAHIDDQDPESFLTFVKESGYEINDIFSPNPASYKKLMRVSRRFGSISVSFDVEDLRQETVKYREDLDAIVILHPPKELLLDMKRALGELVDVEE